MPTHGGTSHGACCMFPFIYQRTAQHRCTRAERGYRWCSTTGNYDTDKQWGFCAPCFLSYDGNSNGNCCHFPFIYGGKMYTTCTTQDDTKPWCATTYNYDVDKQWGYCGGKENPPFNFFCKPFKYIRLGLLFFYYLLLFSIITAITRKNKYKSIQNIGSSCRVRNICWQKTIS